MPEQPSSADTAGFESIAEGIASSFKQAEILMQQFTQQSQDFDLDPLKAAPVYSELMNKMLQNPHKVMQANLDLWKQGLQIYQNSLQSLINDGEAEQTISEAKSDRRFRHDDWLEQPVFNMIKQSYLLISQHA